MAQYMLRANYTQQGLTGLLKEGGTGRRKALTQTVEGVGGSVEAMYYAFGDCDLYLIVDLPDETSAAALSLAIGAAGALDLKITVLLTPETVDDAVAQSVPYRAPGA